MNSLPFVNEITTRYIAYCHQQNLSYYEAQKLYAQLHTALVFAAGDYSPSRSREAVPPDREQEA